MELLWKTGWVGFKVFTVWIGQGSSSWQAHAARQWPALTSTPAQQAAPASIPRPRLPGKAGTEPADVCRSPDGGKTWQDSGGFASIPGRASWSFPAPPHEPHVLSIEAFRTAQGGVARG